jgi:hypothetical protein
MLDVEIELDRKRTLRYDWPAFAAMDREFRKSCGKSTIQLFTELGEDVARDFDVMQTLVWGGLRHQAKDLTPDDVGALLGAFIRKGGDAASLGELVGKALRASGFFGDSTNGAQAVAGTDPQQAPRRRRSG